MYNPRVTPKINTIKLILYFSFKKIYRANNMINAKIDGNITDIITSVAENHRESIFV